ncbi:hypothetical protein [Deinococcus depolymerans]|uniref:Lipoprotein n=1 Tax=Deinococcus depolymerans TaxID=392408 RepID=A0ABN1C7W6_9DEIO
MRFLSLLPLTVLLAACAPSATTEDTFKGPLVEGEQWTISGSDQNNKPLDGKVVVPGAPQYDRTDREWYYRNEGARIYFQERSGEFQVWDTRNPARFVICIVRAPYRYDEQQRRFAGISLSGSLAEINAVFAKLSGSGTRLTGGDCTVTRL